MGGIKWTLWWKASPLAWLLVLVVGLFIPMQWGAPVGPANVYQPVVEIIPNVSGEVIEVPVEGLQTLEKGDVLFRIDPAPYQAAVDQLTAQLADSTQTVERLKAAAASAEATIRSTEASVELLKNAETVTQAEARTSKKLPSAFGCASSSRSTRCLS
jgi:multidrug resistance efflux pump